MKTVKELLEAQAEAVRKQAQLKKQAEAFKKLAADTQAKAEKLIPNFKIKIRMARREEKFNRFKNALNQRFVEDYEFLLKTYGFQPLKEENKPVKTDPATTELPENSPEKVEEKKYIRKDSPGYMIIVNGSNFTAKYHLRTEAQGKVEMLEGYLQKNFQPVEAPKTEGPSLRDTRMSKFDAFAAGNAKRLGVEQPKQPAPLPKPAQPYKSAEEDPMHQTKERLKRIFGKFNS